MSFYDLNKKVASLKKQGLKENKDFRVVYYEVEAEVKMIKKLVK